MRELPTLEAGQDWCCGGCGSGIVKNPKRTDFEFSREEFPNGDVISKTTVQYVAPCCDGELMLWDEGKQDCIPWSYVGTPAAASAEAQEPERLTIAQSREYLVKFMEKHFTDKTFHRYIRAERDGVNLATDFAWQMVRALRMIERTPTATSAGELPTLPKSLLNQIGEYGMARTDGVSEVEVLHRWGKLIDGIKDYARATHRPTAANGAGCQG